MGRVKVGDGFPVGTLPDRGGGEKYARTSSFASARGGGVSDHGEGQHSSKQAKYREREREGIGHLEIEEIVLARAGG